MSAKTNILIVDDDPGLRKTLSDILGGRGYVPIAVATGQAALEVIEEEDPAVALIDLRLEDMSGLEVMEGIKERSPATECIVVTGYASQATAIKAINLGAFSYAQKPYDPEQLLVTIRRAAEKREAEEALEKAAEEWQHSFDTMSDMVTIQDNEFRILRANRATARTFGYEPEKLIGRKCYEVFHRLDCPVENCPLNRSLKSGGVETLEIWEPTIDRWLLITTNPMWDASGRMIGTVHVIRDITKRKRTEATWQALNTAAVALQRAGLSQAEIYQAAAEQLVTLGLRGAVCLFDEATDTLVFEHLFVPPGLLRTLERLTGLKGAGFRFPRTRVPACAQVIETGQAVYVADSPTHIVAKLVPESLSGVAARIMEMVGLANTILAPLRVGGEAVGLLQVGSDWLTEADMPAITAFADQLSAALENARLYQAEQERAAQLAVVNAIGQRLSTFLDVDALLNEVVYQVTETLGYYHAAIGLVEGDELVFRVARGGFEEKGPLPEKRFKIGEEGVTGWVVAHGQPLVVNDVSQEPRFQPDPLVPHVASELAVPLKVQDRVLGVLDVESDRLHAFSETDEALLSTLAGQVAVALENARLYQDVRRRAEETSALLSTAQAISSLDLDAVLETIASQAKALFQADGSRIHLLEPDGETLRCVIALHERAEAVMAMRPKLGQGMTGRVALRGVPELIPNTLADPDSIQVPGTPVEVETMIMAPLKAHERVIGVMTVSRLGEERPFTPADLTFLTAFANQAAVAIENARLFDETRRRAEELAALADVSSALRTARTVEEMLPILLREAAEVIGASFGSIYLVEPESGDLVARCWYPPEPGLIGLRHRPGEGITGHVAVTGEVHISEEVTRDPLVRILPEEAERFRTVRSGISFPLRAQEHTVGVMHIGVPERRSFTGEEVRLLTAIADMAGNAINRASLFEELEHRVHELEALFEMGRAVTASLRVQDVLDLVIRVSPQVLHAEGCFLFLWDEREKRLVLQVAEGMAPDLVGAVRYRQGEGLSGWVFLEGKVANVPDVAADPRWKREEEQEALLPSGQVNSALMVPLIVRDKTLGVLGVVNKTGAPAFTAADESLLAALAGHTAVAIENARLYEDVRDVSLGAIRSLATAIDARDPYTRGHSEGVTELAVRLARELGWSGADLELLEFAALLHDVGKIAIPDAVLRKVEPLTPQEWNLIRLHPYHSRQIVKPVKALYRIVPWLYHHQERWDGTGYPDGLKGEKIPLASRIIAVADAYNAMTTERPYRRAKTREEAIAELRRCAGTQFAPKVVETFLSMMGEHSDSDV